MTEPAPAIPLTYAAPPRRRDSLFGIIGLALALFCATVPAFMLWQLLKGQRHAWPVYKPYAGTVGVFEFGVNWPWYALDTLALLLGVVGLQQGRPRFAAACIVSSVLAMATILTLVLGSPW